MTHLVFDMAAASAAFGMTVLVYWLRLAERTEAMFARTGPAYAFALIGGVAVGGYGFGTANLWLTGIEGVGRSILGALAGGVFAVEVFKAVRGIRGSTGLIFVAGFTTAVTVGRIGCFLSGLDDQTHGVATTLPWGHDFGDGVLRHPVQLYESAAMGAFLLVALAAILRRSAFFAAHGFHLMVGWYAAQRFAWEFLKPYGTIGGPFNLFHLVCAGLILYAGVMLTRRAHV